MDTDLPHVACLAESVGYADAAGAFVEACRDLGDAPLALALRTTLCHEIFHTTEALLVEDADPVPPFRSLMERMTHLLRAAAPPHRRDMVVDADAEGDVAERTGRHYGNLFQAFDPEHYYGEATTLLRTRMERNAFDLTFPAGRRALDAGCGGGRYTVALSRLGFEEVVGLDISETGLADARARLDARPVAGVSFVQGSVLDMPLEDASFDFVFSNGVLHHTPDVEGGLGELLRVLKPGGRGFLYLIEAPGGIFWDVIELLRVLMAPVPPAFARAQFALLGTPANRRFYILDHILVPINRRMTPTEVEQALGAAGAVDIRRWTRGADFDRVEALHRGQAHGVARYGVGENRYVFAKPA